jgi:CRP/FNR family transcriptional regulator, anaerobic regulatory protein
MRRRYRALLPPPDVGPTLRAASFFGNGKPGVLPLLSRRQRERLSEISTRIRVPPRMVLYREETAATALFFNASGVVKAYRDLPSGKRWVTSFLFPDDIFGLAENGLYVRTAQTVTQCTLYRIKLDVLREVLRSDPDLEYHFLCKVTHELRESQHHTVIVGRRDAAGRLAMFIKVLERQASAADGEKPAEIPMPMSRSDVANYLGLSVESVSRATRALERDRILSFPGRHQVRVINRSKFNRLVAKV